MSAFEISINFENAASEISSNPRGASVIILSCFNNARFGRLGSE
jgi:hypothetical protein